MRMRDSGMARRPNVGIQVVRTRPRAGHGLHAQVGGGQDATIPLVVALTTGRIPIPVDVAAQISLDAAARVRAAAPVSPGAGPHARSLIRATWRRNQVGIHIPRQAIHLWYLDQGIAPRIMWELQGKTIPIRLPGGQVIFRKATNVGKQVPRYDRDGRVIGTKIAWKHPGVPAMNFIMPAIEDAIRAWWRRQSPQSIHELVMRNWTGNEDHPATRRVR